jgi:hypothetical protein
LVTVRSDRSAQDIPTDGRLRPDKQELTEALAQMLVDEFHRLEGREQLQELVERRPEVKFFLERIEPELNRPQPAGHAI